MIVIALEPEWKSARPSTRLRNKLLVAAKDPMFWFPGLGLLVWLLREMVMRRYVFWGWLG